MERKEGGAVSNDRNRLELRAGPLSMALHVESAFLRHIRLGRREVLRGIYVALRDQNWGTLEPEISGLSVDRGREDFRISFTARCRRGGIDFLWKGLLTGSPEGTIEYAMEGRARTTFLRNRIGFCILHPIRECAGRPCVVEKTDGTIQRGAFPGSISPNQPFRNMKSITHEAAPGLSARVSLEGEVFEMEDQRNWSDASFKTYCTPLDLPFPVEVPAGTCLQQKVTLRLEGKAGIPPPEIRGEGGGAEVSVRLGPARRLPRLGLCAASHGEPLSPGELNRLKALRLDHLRVDLDLSGGDLARKLGGAAAEAAAIGASLQVALHLGDDAAAALVDRCRIFQEIRPEVSAWLIFHRGEKSTSPRWLELARPVLKRLEPRALLGSGTNAYFAELNRERPPPGAAELICFSVNPQVHASDEASLAETLEAQPQLVESARQFAGNVPVAVTPVTLKPRFNPNATGPEEPSGPGELPHQVDPRQCSLLAAGWTLGSICALSRANTHSATYYETTGWRGIMETDGGSPLPEKFPSIPGSVFPLWHVFADLADLQGAEIRILETGRPLEVQGLAALRGDSILLLLSNLSRSARALDLPDELAGAAFRIRLMAPWNQSRASTGPEEFRRNSGELSGAARIELPPLGIARIEIEKKKREVAES